MSMYANIGDPIGVEEAALRVMEMMPLSVEVSPSLIHLYVLKALVRKPTGQQNWDEIKNYYCEYAVEASNKQRIRMDIELMLACEKFDSVSDAINWFDQYLLSEGRVNITVLHSFRRTLGKDRYESYLKGLDDELKKKIFRLIPNDESNSKLLQTGLT